MGVEDLLGLDSKVDCCIIERLRALRRMPREITGSGCCLIFLCEHDVVASRPVMRGYTVYLYFT